jgi:hypothetical protein
MRNRRVLCRRFRLRNRYRLEIFKKQKDYWRFQDFFCTFAYVKRYFTILFCSLYALLGMAQKIYDYLQEWDQSFRFVDVVNNTEIPY